ncbi:putative transmembrane protein [Labilithrix luteola]|uniref:Putative transmembrane protein n=1 Tax=Labilithrix luteola TaxID=1391654 RepID=A0A0K1QGB0_9BACT|nr:adenosine-specific kinase [Labilithrix luteola]AKV04799.1 putative transmembrane protein [Labilithrix luteola]
MKLESIRVEKPEDVNVVLGQAHFIKTVDDLHEAIVQSAPTAHFGVAFCESSGPRLVRRSGTDEDMVAVAVRAANAIGAGHSFVLMLRDVYPASLLNAIKAVPEVCGIFCATANPIEVVVARSELGNGIVGVIDGGRPLGVESEADVSARRALLKRLGYKV